MMLIKEIRLLVGNGLLDKALDKIYDVIEGKVEHCKIKEVYHNDFYVIKSRYNDLNKKEVTGAIALDDFFMYRAQIANSILCYCENIEYVDSIDKNIKKNTVNFDEKITYNSIEFRINQRFSDLNEIEKSKIVDSLLNILDIGNTEVIISKIYESSVLVYLLVNSEKSKYLRELFLWGYLHYLNVESVRIMNHKSPYDKYPNEHETTLSIDNFFKIDRSILNQVEDYLGYNISDSRKNIYDLSIRKGALYLIDKEYDSALIHFQLAKDFSDDEDWRVGVIICLYKLKAYDSLFAIGRESLSFFSANKKEYWLIQCYLAEASLERGFYEDALFRYEIILRELDYLFIFYVSRLDLILNFARAISQGDNIENAIQRLTKEIENSKWTKEEKASMLKLRGIFKKDIDDKSFLSDWKNSINLKYDEEIELWLKEFQNIYRDSWQ